MQYLHSLQMSGKKIKPNIPSREKADYHHWKLQMKKFISIPSDNHRTQYPAARFCTTTDEVLAVRFLEQDIELNGLSKTTGTIKLPPLRSGPPESFANSLFQNILRNSHREGPGRTWGQNLHKKSTHFQKR